MKIQEANKIIAEYMGLLECSSHMYVSESEMYYMQKGISFVAKKYSHSIDRLVPVWEKVDQIPLFNRTDEVTHSGWLCEIECENSDPKFNYVSGQASTIQEAACIATAKAILENNTNLSIDKKGE